MCPKAPPARCFCSRGRRPREPRRAQRVEGEKYFEAGIPRRISYLIDPEGKIHKAYDVEGDKLDLAGHAQAVLADIAAAS